MEQKFDVLILRVIDSTRALRPALQMVAHARRVARLSFTCDISSFQASKHQE